MPNSQSSSDPDSEPVVIPLATLSAMALAGVLEAFVLREGTDYGSQEFTLTQKVAHVRRQLERGEAEIVFDPQTASVDIRRVEASRRPPAGRTSR